MKQHAWSLGLLSVILLAGLAAPQRPAPEAPPGLRAVDGFVLPEDLEVTLWAETPLFHNPTNLDVDARGRIWVTEAVNYRTFKEHQDYLEHPKGDRVVILEDTDGDGRADASKVFVQDEDLHAPLGLAVIGNRVIVSSAPSLIVYTDEDGDDRADRKEVLLTGFGGFDHDHSLHALVAGPDGRWYFNVGNAGPHVVTDRAGWTLRSGSLYTGGTPYNKENRGRQVSDDGRVWTGGLALRVNPDGSGLAVLAHNFRNAYELAVDSFGDLWQNDNDDEVMACRTTWLMEGGNAGFFSADGSRTWQADRRPGQDTFTAHWHQEDPGVLPSGDRTGAGAPTGIVVYESDLLGPHYRGLLLSADAGRNAVFGYLPAREGAGFRLERTTFLTSVPESTEGYVWNDEGHVRDLRKWFRPSDVAVGTDGALYVADWYDPIVGGHEMHDRAGHGRIYRITPRGRTLRAPEIDLGTTEGQVRALLSPAVNVRTLGFERLRAQGPAVLDRVKRILADPNPYHRARAVWLLARLGPAGEAEVERLLGDPDPGLRIAAIRALRQVRPDVLGAARRLAEDPSPAVRREVALALRGVPEAQALPLLARLAAGYDGQDRWYLEALGLAAEGREDTLYTLVRTRYGGDPAAWDARFAGLAWRLHPARAVADLQARAGSPGVPAPERRRALTALGFVEHADAARAMAALTRSTIPDVAEQAAWWLRYRRTNTWRDVPLAGWQEPPSVVEATANPHLLALRDRVTDEALPIAPRIDAAFELSTDPIGGGLLLALLSAHRLPYHVTNAARTGLSGNPDPLVRTLAGAYFKRPEDPALHPDEVLRRRPDPEAGQQVFYARCASCHRAGAVGGDVGPDLTEIGRKFDRSGLVEAILRPEAAVAHGYEPWLFTTKDGGVHYGFLLADGEVVVLKTAQGQQVSLAADRIDRRTKVETSLMPPPDVLGLSAQEVADVAAFLQGGR